jgi:hypothetical protein
MNKLVKTDPQLLSRAIFQVLKAKPKMKLIIVQNNKTIKKDSKASPSGPKSELFATTANNPATKAIAALKMIFRIFI